MFFRRTSYSTRQHLTPSGPPKPLPILDSSDFVPENGFLVVKALNSSAFHGSDQSSRIASGRVDTARPVMFENLLTRSDPTREISNTSRPEPTRPASFF